MRLGLVFFIDLGNMITNDAGCTREIISKTVSSKAAPNRKKTLFASKSGLDLRKKLVNCYIRSIALYGAGTWTLPKIDQNYLKSLIKGKIMVRPAQLPFIECG